MVNSQRSLNQCLESIVQKVQGGVVIHFEKYGPDPPPVSIEDQRLPPNGVTTISLDGEPPNGEKLDAKLSIVNDNPNSHFKSWHTCRKQIYVQRSAQKGYSVGHWPIPEAFWPDLNSQTLAPRTCHPIIRFTCTNNEPKAIEQLPFDKYEIESCPLTNYILLRKQPHVAWQCFISNSSNAGYFNNCECFSLLFSLFGDFVRKPYEFLILLSFRLFFSPPAKNDLGLPFGYLKASTNLTCVNLYVLPYNYPVLLPLLDDLMKGKRIYSSSFEPIRSYLNPFESIRIYSNASAFDSYFHIAFHFYSSASTTNHVHFSCSLLPFQCITANLHENGE